MLRSAKSKGRSLSWFQQFAMSFGHHHFYCFPKLLLYSTELLAWIDWRPVAVKESPCSGVHLLLAASDTAPPEDRGGWPCIRAFEQEFNDTWSSEMTGSREAPLNENVHGLLRKSTSNVCEKIRLHWLLWRMMIVVVSTVSGCILRAMNQVWLAKCR